MRFRCNTNLSLPILNPDALSSLVPVVKSQRLSEYSFDGRVLFLFLRVRRVHYNVCWRRSTTAGPNSIKPGRDSPLPALPAPTQKLLGDLEIFYASCRDDGTRARPTIYLNFGILYLSGLAAPGFGCSWFWLFPVLAVPVVSVVPVRDPVSPCAVRIGRAFFINTINEVSNVPNTSQSYFKPNLHKLLLPLT